jgi:hypothetical protein
MNLLLWAFLFCPKWIHSNAFVNENGQGGNVLTSNAVLSNSLDRGGFNPNYGRLGSLKKVQHLEAVSSEKPNKESTREDIYDVSKQENNTRFKTYSKEEVEDSYRSAKEAAVIFNQWKHEITESAADFIHTFKGELKELTEPVTETYKDKISDSLEHFLSALKIELEVSLGKSPIGQMKRHLMSAHELLGTIREVLWRQIEYIAKDHVPVLSEEKSSI